MSDILIDVLYVHSNGQIHGTQMPAEIPLPHIGDEVVLEIPPYNKAQGRVRKITHVYNKTPNVVIFLEDIPEDTDETAMYIVVVRAPVNTSINKLVINGHSPVTYGTMQGHSMKQGIYIMPKWEIPAFMDEARMNPYVITAQEHRMSL